MREELLRLYAITDVGLSGPHFFDHLASALRGGATMVQLRLKGKSFEEFCAVGRQVKALCQQAGVPLIVNDSLDVALALDADGLHLGQGDGPFDRARRALKGKILGITAHNALEALQAQGWGADYLGVGAFFPTATKSEAKLLTRPEFMRLRGAVSLPLVGIGGITLERMEELRGLGLSGVALAGALFGSGSVEENARRLRGRADELFLKGAEHARSHSPHNCRQ